MGDERVLSDLEISAIHANFALNADRSLKTLGITWNARDDTLHYLVHPF